MASTPAHKSRATSVSTLDSLRARLAFYTLDFAVRLGRGWERSASPAYARPTRGEK